MTLSRRLPRQRTWCSAIYKAPPASPCFMQSIMLIWTDSRTTVERRLRSCHSTARHVVQAGKSARRTIPYRVVISRASTGFKPEVEKVVVQALANANLPTLKVPVFERTAFKRASFSRIAPIFEEPNGGAAQNLKAVYAEVRDTLADIVASAREAV